MVELDQRAVKRVVEPRPNREATQGGEGVQRNNGASKTSSWTTSLVSAPLRLSHSNPILRKTNMRAKPPLLLLSFPNSNFPGQNKFGDAGMWCARMDVHRHLRACFVKQHTPFHRSPCVYPCWFSSRRVIFCQFYCSQWVQNPLAALPSAVAQLGMDLAGHGHSGRWSHPHIEVMKEDSVPHTPTPTHGHRGEEAPRGHAGWRLRPHSHSWQDRAWLLSRWWCQGVLPAAAHSYPAQLWSAPQPLQYSQVSISHLYLFMLELTACRSLQIWVQPCCIAVGKGIKTWCQRLQCGLNEI